MEERIGEAFAGAEQLTVGGQTMPVVKMQEVEARFGCPLLEVWGMTEVAGAGTTPFKYRFLGKKVEKEGAGNEQ